jgi:hypothetical protein
MSYKYIINSSGSYYLTGDVTTSSKSAIRVNADDVTIDLAGFTLAGPNSGSFYYYGVYMNGRVNVEIRNGTTRGYFNGIHENDQNSHGHRVINIRAISNAKSGIYLPGKNNLIKDCSISDTGGVTGHYIYGIRTGEGSTVTGNLIYNNGISHTTSVFGISASFNSTVIGNTIRDNGTSATGAIFVYGILASNGCTVSDNTVANNGDSAGASSVVGIQAQDACTVSNNTSHGNGDNANASFVIGINAEYGSTMTGNTSYKNGLSATGDVRGISTRPGSTIVGNTSYGNGGLAAGDVYGIYLWGGNLVDQNTAYDNGIGAGSATNMNLGVGGCVYGINVAP